ncbi:DUF1624 domain-containing protein [Yangia sp. PrR003]|nr:DUF1624 domain-containing protein [Salipiger sp. PrR003]
MRAPSSVSADFALVILWLGNAEVATVFQSPWLAWTGLSAQVPPALDFLHLVPWLRPFLSGIALAHAACSGGFRSDPHEAFERQPPHGLARKATDPRDRTPNRPVCLDPACIIRPLVSSSENEVHGGYWCRQENRGGNKRKSESHILDSTEVRTD